LYESSQLAAQTTGNNKNKKIRGEKLKEYKNLFQRFSGQRCKKSKQATSMKENVVQLKIEELTS